MNLTLVVLAAGLSTRYGGIKQLEPVGPSGEALMDYGIFDAMRAGLKKIVLVTRPELERALREHIEKFFPDAMSLGFAYQQLGAIPERFAVPEGRRKPWGTGHAVLSAETRVSEPFVAINADDFYGTDAFTALARHLEATAESDPTEFAAAGYGLRDTLSPHGGVSRAVCEVDAAGYLRTVTEVKQIETENGGLAGVTVAGERYVLTGDETVSMNIWAATPAAFPLLHDRFERFLDEHGGDLDAEFLLSTAVDDLIAAERARVKVIPARGPWLGVTYQEDRRYVEERLRELVAEGRYPRELSASSPGS